MELICLHDKEEIETFLRQNVALHIYSLGDLDQFFWPYTQWYGLKIEGHLRAIALLYVALSPPILLALTPSNEIQELRNLLTWMLPLLPKHVYLHLSLETEDILQSSYHLTSHGVHHKMLLVNPVRVQGFETSDVIRLTPAHLTEIVQLYHSSYPDNVFDPRMLETGQFFGIWKDHQLVSIAGVHVYSPNYRVAAIGNVTTHPDYRNQGLGKSVMAALTRSLLETVDDIGLNVKHDNYAAIHSYEKIGFEVVDSYHELMAN